MISSFLCFEKFNKHRALASLQKSEKAKLVKRHDLRFNKKFISGDLFALGEFFWFLACAILKFV